MPQSDKTEVIGRIVFDITGHNWLECFEGEFLIPQSSFDEAASLIAAQPRRLMPLKAMSLVGSLAASWSMTQSPKAADFTCVVNGRVLPWNSDFGLRCRWFAAGVCENCRPDSLATAAAIATKKIQEQIGNDSVIVEVAA